MLYVVLKPLEEMHDLFSESAPIQQLKFMYEENRHYSRISRQYRLNMPNWHDALYFSQKYVFPFIKLYKFLYEL